MENISDWKKLKIFVRKGTVEIKLARKYVKTYTKTAKNRESKNNTKMEFPQHINYNAIKNVTFDGVETATSNTTSY